MALRDGDNTKIARVVTSCPSCLAWGLTYSRAKCEACHKFAARHKITGDCAGCGRSEPLKIGYCRLCWAQLALERPAGQRKFPPHHMRKVRHQQLFLAGFSRRRATPRKFPRRRDANGHPLKLPPPPVAGRPRVIWVQLALFVVPRRYRYGRVHLRWGPAPENEWFAWALHLAHTMAEARGFAPSVLLELNQTLAMLLAEHRDGELIRSSDLHDVLRERCTSIRHTSVILERMGVLLDDRPTTFENWLADKLEGLAPGIRSETERWARALHDGGPRTRARSPSLVKRYLRAIRPSLLEWSACYQHLREVTREDILVKAEPLYGQERQTMLVASRSLFAWAKKNGVVFRDPASSIKVRKYKPPVLQPLHPEEITRTIEAATTPEARLFVALAAVHAARVGAVRAMQLDDVDLPNRRLTIAGHTRPLDDLTHRALLEWLDYRRRRWPNTANKHLLISRITANGLGPVSKAWTHQMLGGLTATLERLRIDRQLEEALTHRADPLHLAVVFDIDESTAIRYAASARQLLEQPHEAPPSGSPQTQASISHNHPSEHSGSH